MTTVFFDRTCGKSLPHALKLLGIDAEAHQDHFPQNVHDDVWLADVGQRGWIVFTYDKRIRYNQSERQALLTHGVGCFMLTSGNRTKWEQMRIVAKAWDRIQEVIAKTPLPFIQLVHADGTIEALYPAPPKTGRPP